MSVKIEDSWKTVLAEEFERPYFAGIKAALVEARQAGKTIYPPGPLIFNAFNSTPFHAVRCVILGQDPYHNPGEAMGLSFSVPRGVRVPPSLQNIFKALELDCGTPPPRHGDLSAWAKQGVLLLNAFLTVERNQPASHQKIGWQEFTDAAIQRVSEGREHVVFMLWGRFAQSKKRLIDPQKHLILEAAHPSPLAGNSFLSCRHFSKANEFLRSHNMGEIDWGAISA